MRSVIFDLDGTLADTSGDLLAAANACFRAMGHGDILGPGDAGVALRGGKMMLRAGLTRLGSPEGDALEAEIARWYPELLTAYGAALDHHTVLYPGALEAVAALKARGFAVGICTNKPAALAEALMVSLAARDAFGALVGADTLPVRKPDPRPLVETVTRLGGDPARTCLVGDSVTDRETARAAGVPSILVTFGPSGEDMAALAPEALLDDYAALPDLAERLVA